MNVRTRVAPSPTGDPHVGTAYIALFNLCFARQHGGEFILRIEDTDQVRSTRESEQMILDSLNWLGLTWDEGPDVGGPHGPYRQSERAELYKEHAQILLESGHAFRCFCTQERLNDLRKEQMQSGSSYLGYDGHCIGLSEAEVQEKLDAGVPHVVRMKVPRDGGVCVVNDMLRGEIEIEWSQVDMQVLMKSDGLPTYHLANVVDDHHMRITHVMRGEEWINSAPKHLLLYKAFGWEPPVLCHLPLLRNPDKSKLSKRKNPTSILYYQRMGFLPQALVNYLGLMGWSMPDEREKFTVDEMVAAFDIKRISLGGPIFDRTKLAWLNGRWIREELTVDDFAKEVVKWALNEEYMKPIIPLIQERALRLSDVAPLIAHFFMGSLEGMEPKEKFNADEKVAVANITAKFDSAGLEREEILRVLQWGQWALEAEPKWEEAALKQALFACAENMDLKLRVFLKPFFIAISGREVSTPLFASMDILGRDICRARINDAIRLLGGVGKKKLKKWRKAFDQAQTV